MSALGLVTALIPTPEDAAFDALSTTTQIIKEPIKLFFGIMLSNLPYLTKLLYYYTHILTNTATEILQIGLHKCVLRWLIRVGLSMK
jgi:hypothetical protein